MVLKNTIVQEGFRTLKYPNQRKERDPIRYLHINDAVGRVWLIFVFLTAEASLGRGTAHIIDRKFKDAGLKKEVLKQAVDARLPAYPSYYLDKTGKTLRANIYYDRYHKKGAYTNGPKGKGGTPGQSNEHPTKSEKLRPIFPRVEKAFLSGKVLTIGEMFALG